MDKKKKTWFEEKAEACLNNGVVIKEKTYRMTPYIVDGKVGKSTCKRCGSINGFVFEAPDDVSIKVVFCLRCDKCTMYEPEIKLKESTETNTPTQQKQRCIAETKVGGQCKLMATTGSKYCAYHTGRGYDTETNKK